MTFPGVFNPEGRLFERGRLFEKIRYKYILHNKPKNQNVQNKLEKVQYKACLDCDNVLMS